MRRYFEHNRVFNFSIPGTTYTVAEANRSVQDTVLHCFAPECGWLDMPQLVGLRNVPPLYPNPELSGIGVILGFSITAYLTLILLILHYLTVHNPRRTSPKGNVYINPVDAGILFFIRERLVSWSPSRRFEYAMERSVLIISDTQLVTGLGILVAGYSQLRCGISAYHWQIMVFVAWFASFSFLSAMAFLEGYFQTNRSMRIIRVCFMVLLAALLIAALLPTGSKNWLDLFMDGDGYYPSLSAACYYKQMVIGKFTRRGPKIWSMAFSVFVVAVSYTHSAARLFDPTAEVSRKYLRQWPGMKVKSVLRFLERRGMTSTYTSVLWAVPYLVLYAAFVSARAFCDLAESMLLEIIWLTFAIAWGTIKVWTTRDISTFSYDGFQYTTNEDVLEENSWSFGQTLPMVLILLPLLSMAQAYLDNDAEAQEALERSRNPEKHLEKSLVRSGVTNIRDAGLRFGDNWEGGEQGPRRSTSCSLIRCNHHPSLCPTRSDMFHGSDRTDPDTSDPPTSVFQLPRFPYTHFTSYPWYNDHILLLICQTLMITGFSLWVLTELANILGISAILRNRLFLLWVLGMVPAASFVHLLLWFTAGLFLSKMPRLRDWLQGETMSAKRGDEIWWKKASVGKVMYWNLRIGAIGGCLMLTFFVSLEAASPYPVDENLS